MSSSTSTLEISRRRYASDHVDQQGVGSAAAFRVTTTQSSAPRPTESSHAPASALGSSLRILVVDDNRDSAVSLSILLSLTGHETTTAFDGEEALDTADRFQPDVVLLDIGLPKLNGYEVCRALRAVPRERRLVIVALTGWGQDDDRRKSVQAGFDAHLVKPVDPDALQRTLRQLIA